MLAYKITSLPELAHLDVAGTSGFAAFHNVRGKQGDALREIEGHGLFFCEAGRRLEEGAG